MVRLDEFVRDVLTQIVTGVTAAQDAVDGTGADINSHIRMPGNRQHDQWVTFDVALTAEDTDQKKGGIGVMAGLLSAGGTAEATARAASVSRVQFKIHLALPDEAAGHARRIAARK